MKTAHAIGHTLALALLLSLVGPTAQAQVPYLLNGPKDMATDFADPVNTLFLADSLSTFDADAATGTVVWRRYRMSPRQAFNTNGYWPIPLPSLDFPATEYDPDPALGLQVRFVSPRTLRLTMLTSPIAPAADDDDDPMLVAPPADGRSAWQTEETDEAITYRSVYGSVEIRRYPWRLIVRDATGRELTRSRAIGDNDSTQVKLLPFCFIKRGADNRRSICPVFSLQPGERIYGCGESFTGLNKVGQRVQLFVTDPQGPETPGQYKPVPFYMSNRGYGVFMHTAAPVTCDFGRDYIGAQSLYMADERMDIFVFLGEPKDILDEYTDLTGKSPMLPLWTFGTWMSRISYFSQDEGLDIAAQLRRHRIPADVIHFDTGWFSVDWQCDYAFDSTRFPDPVGMLKQLRADGFHACLWQLPYFTPKNRLFGELISEGLSVRNAAGSSPYEDAVLDFTNPHTVAWYQAKIGSLIDQGVSVIKCDFGEAAPLDGIYYNGRGGLYEHNLYPLRYNRALWEAVRAHSGDQYADGQGQGVIWARSAWAGSQRYPLHWGGDAATTDVGMLGDLRGGLSLGLSGFAFWSHDIGGFVTQTPEDLYRRWLPFGFLSSHSRAHGAPPTEPWLISETLTDAFRQSAELKYRLMPYVYAQAKDCTERGLPMVRALLVEFPHDPAAWLVEDQYLFGSDMLVAPLLQSGTSRTVYLPAGVRWIDYQDGTVYEGGRYYDIAVGPIPCVILVRDGSVVPHAELAQHTADIDWARLDLRAYRSAPDVACRGLLYRPGDAELSVVEQ